MAKNVLAQTERLETGRNKRGSRAGAPAQVSNESVWTWEDVIEDILIKNPKGIPWTQLLEKALTYPLAPSTSDVEREKLEILAAIPERYLSDSSNKVRRVAPENNLERKEEEANPKNLDRKGGAVTSTATTPSKFEDILPESDDSEDDEPLLTLTTNGRKADGAGSDPQAGIYSDNEPLVRADEFEKEDERKKTSAAEDAARYIKEYKENREKRKTQWVENLQKWEEERQRKRMKDLHRRPDMWRFRQVREDEPDDADSLETEIMCFDVEKALGGGLTTQNVPEDTENKHVTEAIRRRLDAILSSINQEEDADEEMEEKKKERKKPGGMKKRSMKKNKWGRGKNK